MARAIRLAAAPFPPPHPNPRVGCVIVRAGRVLGEGAHRRAGEAHAEVIALASCTESPRGATVYVTLEPCAHYGRTPPCADALIEAGVGRVVVAHRDPHPQVAGAGIARLRAAGIEVSEGLLGASARDLNRGFLRRVAGGDPWVRVKLAASLDARTALASGESRWITSEAARRDVHRQRAMAAAVVTGAGTIRCDDPQLTARDVEPPLTAAQQPPRVVLDPRLRRVTPQAALLQAPGSVWLCHDGSAAPERIAALQAVGAEVIAVAAQPDGQLSLRDVLDLLRDRQVNEVWVEAGATLAGAWVAADLVDELVLYTAPCLLGEGAQPLLRLPLLTNMAARRRVRFQEVRRVGEELRVSALLEKSAAGEE
ncbi:riboflavin biosynthesis protein RibD [Halorhodospira abdelmalekii]|nr:riboflavin biosynthesis protein RibD [Halorhodospira abdelmalekii]